MHKPIAMAALLAAMSGAHAASDNDLQAIRAQIAEMKAQYEQRIAQLEARLAQATPAPAAAAATGHSHGHAHDHDHGRDHAGHGEGFSPEVSAYLQGRYQRMKAVPERGITGFWPAGGDHDHGAAGPKRGFSMDHTEVMLAAEIDQRWRGQLHIALFDEQTEVEEAWVQSLGSRHTPGVRLGRFRSGIGVLNAQHPHYWDFADAPLAYQALFGSHGSYIQDGAQLRWQAPVPAFLEFGAELGRGAAFPGTDRNVNGSGAGALFARLGNRDGASHAWRTGLSYLETRASERAGHFEDRNADEVEAAFSGTSRTLLADLVWKWYPEGDASQPRFKFQAEAFLREEEGSVTCENGLCGAGSTDAYRSRQSGWYAQGVYRVAPSWRVGLRHERLDSGSRHFGANAANLAVDAYRPEKTTAMVDYGWSEFSRVRLQYAHDQSMAGITDHQWTLQYIMSLGAHRAHPF